MTATTQSNDVSNQPIKCFDYELDCPKKWYSALHDCQKNGLPHVLVTVVKVSGSAPRDLQAKMVITNTDYFDTIGGGGLEFEVIKTARQLLQQTASAEVIAGEKHQHKSVLTKHYPLAAKLGQCCGGSVTVLFESFNIQPPLSILLFGAGHVAKALVTLLSQLQCQVHWVDNRPEIFNSNQVNALPAHIHTHVSDEPTELLSKYNSASFVLVMTHDHSLDFEIVKAAIACNRSRQINAQNQPIDNESYPFSGLADSNGSNTRPFPYIGCIASKTKAKRFQQRLVQRGFSEAELNILHMPIGVPIASKEPMAVAISIMGQVLQLSTIKTC